MFNLERCFYILNSSKWIAIPNTYENRNLLNFRNIVCMKNLYVTQYCILCRTDWEECSTAQPLYRLQRRHAANYCQHYRVRDRTGIYLQSVFQKNKSWPMLKIGQNGIPIDRHCKNFNSLILSCHTWNIPKKCPTSDLQWKSDLDPQLMVHSHHANVMLLSIEWLCNLFKGKWNRFHLVWTVLYNLLVFKLRWICFRLVWTDH